ncbi:hypothetical protein KUCAC02_020671 [Chaenocephalus aceratus]|uniref:Uncharacterized protein n=1 Tax=Chaenocephalus aceratus TaxID=36190 RepID=A0ACB9XEI3_CHAAC|nr:hypothetical protein KUCAC02_020671 [Chaenocephalus aceratus]
MGGGGHLTEAGEPGSGRAGGVYTWEEVQSHCNRNDQWLVIDRKVYNITQWAKRHPGGSRVISHYAGEDASEAFTAFHPNIKYVQKFSETPVHWRVGSNRAKSGPGQKRGHHKRFSTLYVLQAGWLQHDFGHLSVFKKSSWNHVLHKFSIGHLKGASANWWNHRHFQHHAKPNIFSKDPDVNMLHVFVVGATQPVEYGIKKIKYMPYHYQHQYFFLVGPPATHSNLLPRADHTHHDFTPRLGGPGLVLSYYLRYLCCSIPMFGLFGSVLLITFVRFLESHWFVWVTQMNHLPMDIDHDKHRDWPLHLKATCNIKQSPFNDWFSGHLNFQIEHHLFPTMPRHNYHRVAPLVRALCEKHGIPYNVKTMWQGIVDVFRSLKNSGDLWLDAYLHK